MHTTRLMMWKWRHHSAVREKISDPLVTLSHCRNITAIAALHDASEIATDSDNACLQRCAGPGLHSAASQGLLSLYCVRGPAAGHV